MKKRTAAGIAVVVTALGAAVNMTFRPEELTHSADWLEARAGLEQAGELSQREIEYTEPAAPTRADALRDRLLRLPVAVKALLLLPLWAVGALPVALGTAAASALGPLWAHVLGFLLQAGVLLGVFCAVYKLIFPERKLRELFQKKNRRWLLLGAAALTGTNLVLTQMWGGWPILRAVLMTCAGFGVLCLLWKRICGRLRRPGPGVLRTRLKLEY